MSGIGRFTGKDSLGYPGYEYVRNNPMKFNDPNGMTFIDASSRGACDGASGSVGWWLVFLLGLGVAIYIGYDIYKIHYSGDDQGLISADQDILINVYENDIDIWRYCKQGRKRCQECCTTEGNISGCESMCQSYFTDKENGCYSYFKKHGSLIGAKDEYDPYGCVSHYDPNVYKKSKK